MANSLVPNIAVPGTLVFNKTLPFHWTRNPVKHTGRGFRAKFCSHKNRRMIRCESLLEMEFLFLAEFAKNVVAFDEQPITISYRLHSHTRRYTPDFVLRWADGRNWYVEVKPMELLTTEKNQAKFSAVKEHFAAQGDVFITITEHEIRDAQRQAHVKKLLRLRHEIAHLPSLPSSIHQDGVMSFGDLMLKTNSESEAMQLLAHRDLSFNLKEDLCDDTLITYFTEADDAALFV